MAKLAPATLFLLGASCLTPLAASAAPLVFSHTGATESFTANAAGTYRIVANGASGGSNSYLTSFTGLGGFGAQAAGTVTLSFGQVLTLIVGGVGGSGIDFVGGGGGGGSFVFDAGSMAALVVAGGGGGAGSPGVAGFDATTTTTGAAGGVQGGGTPAPGGTATQGGGGGEGVGGGGGGSFDGAGGNGDVGSGRGGAAATAGGAGGAGSAASAAGGFGGGGSSGLAGGGGGGYGGGGGGAGGQGGGSGGGGGSFVTASATDIQLSILALRGDGSISIEFLGAPPVGVPAPAALLLFGTGLLGLAGACWRRQPAAAAADGTGG